MKKKENTSSIHSSAAEYLTFVAATGDHSESVEMRYQDENIRLTQKMMAALYDVSVAAINQHIKRIYADGELDSSVTIKKYLMVQTEGTRQIEREIDLYNLQMIIAVGFKVNNERAARGKILKADVSIAKNYLNEREMNYPERIVSVYLDFAELRAERKIPMSMEDWAKRLDGFLEFNGNEILIGPGKISHEQAKLHAETECEKYRVIGEKGRGAALILCRFNVFYE
ncbi:MAG: virulence RhuM family protein [Clostridiales Family XIII bacterium]|jgi:hypothetical protein|nr:virulence RhuM family protein [Clostridiales Family XIII bacterium]